MKCLEREGYNALLQGCIAYDQLDGILVEYSFPARKKEYFAEFRNRIREILSEWRSEGQRNCGPEN